MSMLSVPAAAIAAFPVISTDVTAAVDTALIVMCGAIVTTSPTATVPEAAAFNVMSSVETVAIVADPCVPNVRLSPTASSAAQLPPVSESDVWEVTTPTVQAVVFFAANDVKVVAAETPVPVTRTVDPVGVANVELTGKLSIAVPETLETATVADAVMYGLIVTTSFRAVAVFAAIVTTPVVVLAVLTSDVP